MLDFEPCHDETLRTEAVAAPIARNGADACGNIGGHVIAHAALSLNGGLSPRATASRQALAFSNNP